MLNLHLIFSYHPRITWHHLEGALCLLVENQLFHKHRVWPYSNIHECGITPEEKWVFLLLKINVGYFQFQHQYVKTWKLSYQTNKQKPAKLKIYNALHLTKDRIHRADATLNYSIRDPHVWGNWWNHGLVRTTEWQFWRTVGGWVQSNMRSINCLGLKSGTCFQFHGLFLQWLHQLPTVRIWKDPCGVLVERREMKPLWNKTRAFNIKILLFMGKHFDRV